MLTYYGLTSWENIFLSIMALIIIIIFGGVIYTILYAIFLFIFSKGDEKKIKQAWDSIRYAIIGVLFTIFLLFVFPIIFQKLHIPGYRVYTAKNIFKRASKILQQTFKAFKSNSTSSTTDLDTNL